jgi:Tol biopolymer transport system component
VGSVHLDGSGLVWLTEESLDASYPDLSPEGDRLCFVRRDAEGGRDIVIRSLADGSPERVAVNDATLPSFSPDGRHLAFARSRSHAGGVGVLDLEAGEPVWLTRSGTWPTWSSDGRAVAYADLGATGNQAVWLVGLDGAPARIQDYHEWAGEHWPFVLTGPDELITTDSTGGRRALWLAEY